jgi:rubrerythrin
MSNIITDNTRKLFLVFKKAVEAEQEAQTMYKEAISVCDDTEGRKILEEFLADEIRHEKEIMNQYNKLRKNYPNLENA